MWRRFPTTSLTGRTLAVLGLGAVGGRLAAVGAAFGMRVVGTRRSGRPVPGVAELHAPAATREAIAAADGDGAALSEETAIDCIDCIDCIAGIEGGEGGEVLVFDLA